MTLSNLSQMSFVISD